MTDDAIDVDALEKALPEGASPRWPDGREKQGAPRTDAPLRDLSGPADEEPEGPKLQQRLSDAFGELGAYALLTFWGWRIVAVALYSDIDVPEAGKEFGVARTAFAWRHDRVAFHDGEPGSPHQFFDTTTALRVTRDVLSPLWSGQPQIDPAMREALEAVGSMVGSAINRVLSAARADSGQ